MQIVIEIHEYAFLLAVPHVAPFGPLRKRRVSITAVVFFSRSVQTYVDKIRGDFERGLVIGQFVDAKGTPVLAEQFIRPFIVPARVSKLKGVAIGIRQCRQKLRKTTFVEPPGGG